VVTMLGGGTGATQADLEKLRHELGLDQPLPVQYWRFISQAVQGDMGVSLRFRQPALPLVLERLPATIQLAVSSLLLALIVALPIGVLSAIYPRSWVDRVAMTIALIGQSVPLFWLGIMLVLVLSVAWQLFPPGGYGTWQHLVLPTLTLGALPMARIARLTRSSMLEVVHQDYMTTARAKGLSEPRVIIAHGLKNAALPVVTVVGLMFGTLLGGAVITETIFAWPGVGLLSVQAIQNRDFPLVQAAVLVVSFNFIFINLLVDLFYAYLDPRIKYN
jgi:peptide/nickel transport system permease protein